MDVVLLGPIEVRYGKATVALGRRRERALLGLLLLEAGTVVPTERLLDLLWTDDPPATAANQLRVNASRLRRALDPDGTGHGGIRILSQGAGYLAEVARDRVDAHRFTDLVGRAGEEADPLARLKLLDEALGLWRGPLLADAISDELRQRIALDLDESRLAAAESRAGTQLLLGRAGDAVASLRELAERHPLRERLIELLLVALEKDGRRAEALDVYQRHRARLADELGVDPGDRLRAWHQAALHGDADPATTANVPDRRAVPAELPPDIASFTGRLAQLSRLDAAVGPTGRAATPVIISAVSGTAGIGKTALAVHWAHRNRHRFPDGQLFADLRGHAVENPVPPLTILTRFLRALGVPDERIPPDLPAAITLFRSMLADRRVLVLLDNAASPDQVRPLLPGTLGSVAVITSRERLSGLLARDDARRLDLGPLDRAEAHQLLVRMLGADRLSAQGEAASALAEACAYLPLALRIAASHLGDRPHLPLADYLAELSASGPLDRLRIDGDEQTAVRAAFSLSYASLPTGPRRMFRLFGLVPGPDLTVPAAAALAGVHVDEARLLLDRLTAAHLLEQLTEGRFSGHDLLRAYAAEMVADTDAEPYRLAALTRLYGYYQSRVDAATSLLNPQMMRLPTANDDSPDEPFTSAAHADGWLEAERLNLTAAVVAAPSTPAELVWRLADGIRGYFLIHGSVPEWLDVATHALAVAEAAGNETAQAAAHLSLGSAHFVSEQWERGAEHCTRALVLSRRTGWVAAEAAALGNLALMYFDDAGLIRFVDYAGQVDELSQRTGWVKNQAVNLNNLGAAYRQLGRLTEAADHFTRAVEAFQQIGSAFGHAISLGGLGETNHELGNLDRAEELLNQALPVHRDNRDRTNEAELLRCLADLYRDTGRIDEGVLLARQALETAEQIGRPRFQAEVLNTLGQLHRARGEYRAASHAHQRAIHLAAQGGADHYPRARGLIGMAAVQRALGALTDSLQSATEGLRLARKHSFRTVEGHALIQLSATELLGDDPSRAAHHAARAITIHERTSHLLGLADALHLAGHARGGTAELARAAELYHHLGLTAEDRFALSR